MVLPRLHVITDDAVLADAGFEDRATALLEAHGPALAFHVRGPGTPTRDLYRWAEILAPRARSAGALFLVNDRVDVALAVDADGVQLGQRSLPVTAVRALAPDWVVGKSVHDTEEAEAAAGADFLLLGTIWATASHPDRDGAGAGLVRDVHGMIDRPVVAIGGVSPERVAVARTAGAAGVAALSGIWTGDPVAAAAAYLEALEKETE